MKAEDYATLLFREIEIELTQALKEHCGDRNHWPPKIVQEAEERQKSKNRDSFIEALFFQQKVEAIGRFSHLLQDDPTGKAVAENLPFLISLNPRIRNDISHAIRIEESDLYSLLKVAENLLASGCKNDEIAEKSHLLLRSLQESGRAPESPNTSVIHNLPKEEYFDTGFVGRGDSVRQVLASLKSDSPMDSYIWLVGLGGSGKTAVAREVCDRLIREPDPTFDFILWNTFKEFELSGNGTRTVSERIADTAELLKALSLASSGGSFGLKECLKQFRDISTLIVLDNLDTYPGELEELIQASPPPSVKLLITSREHTGFGRRMEIPELELNECRTYLSRLANFYSVPELSSYVRNDSAFSLLVDQLGRTPLALKWLTLSCERGDSVDQVLANRHNLLEYCTESVFRKLSSHAKAVLPYLLHSDSQLSAGEVTQISGMTPEVVQTALNELSRFSMLQPRSETGVVKTTYAIHFVVRDYLRSHELFPDFDREKIQSFSKEVWKAKLRTNRFEDEPYSPYEIDGSEDYPYMAYELKRLLSRKRANSSSEIEERLEGAMKSCQAEPNYWETWRVCGEIFSWSQRWDRCIEYFEEALRRVPGNRPLSYARVNYMLGQKLLKIDNPKAISFLRMAQEIDPGFVTNLELSRALLYAGNFDESLDLMRSISYEGLSERDQVYFQRQIFQIDKRRLEPSQKLSDQSRIDKCRDLLQFWYDSTPLRWDCPNSLKNSICDDLVDVFDLLVWTHLKKTDEFLPSIIEEFERFDIALRLFGFHNWLEIRLQEEYGKLGLQRIVQVMKTRGLRLRNWGTESPSSSDTVGRGKSSKASDSIRVRGILKVWDPVLGRGFVTCEIADRKTDCLFTRFWLEDPDTEDQLMPGLSILSGIAQPSNHKPGGYIIKRVTQEFEPKDSSKISNNQEIKDSTESLEKAIVSQGCSSWDEVISTLLYLIDQGKCFQNSMELNGLLFSSIGSLLQTVGENFPQLGVRPGRIIDIVSRSLSELKTSDLKLVASKHGKPHPMLVRGDRIYGRSLWNGSERMDN